MSASPAGGPTETLCPYCYGRVPEQCQSHVYAVGDVVEVTTPHRAAAQYADGREGAYAVVRQSGGDVVLARLAFAPTQDWSGVSAAPAGDGRVVWMSTRRCRLIRAAKK